MYHIFIHSPADGHSGCFHVLTIVNSAAASTDGFSLLLPTWRPAIQQVTCFLRGLMARTSNTAILLMSFLYSSIFNCYALLSPLSCFLSFFFFFSCFFFFFSCPLLSNPYHLAPCVFQLNKLYKDTQVFGPHKNSVSQGQIRFIYLFLIGG